MNNVIHIEFYSKDNFPPGKWMSEPDLCFWERELPCLAIRDMKLGIWKGFVAVDEGHPFYEKRVEDLLQLPNMLDVFQAVHGGICGVGHLVLPKYSEYAGNRWWLGIETSHGEDLMPLIKLDPSMAKMTSNQTYKDLRFIRRETNKLARVVSKYKCQ